MQNSCKSISFFVVQDILECLPAIINKNIYVIKVALFRDDIILTEKISIKSFNIITSRK